MRQSTFSTPIAYALTLSFFLFVSGIFGKSHAQQTKATELLKSRNAEFQKDIVHVTDNVYTSVGHTVSTVSMIVGTDGVIIIDTGMSTSAAEEILSEFRNISQKPIKGIIYTHGHGDHTGGASIFAKEDDPEIWARDNIKQESETLKEAGLTIQAIRGARQGGFKLPPEQRINNGIAPAVYPNRGGEAFEGGSGYLPPTHTFSTNREVVEIAGVQLELVAAGGETYDQLYVWYPEGKVVFSGDNFYKSWPNLYAIRGVPYRDVLDWADATDRMLKEGPEYLVPGHTRPVLGEQEVTRLLTDYRDAIRFVFDKTIEGMNKGLTPDELVDYVQLPEELASKDYLREYYGNIEWGVRSIFTGYLGWFNGNPTELFSLHPADEAAKMADLAGGQQQLLVKAQQALKEGEYQWAAQLSDHLIALDKDAKEPKLIKANALTELANELLTATGRNYYLTVARELRQEAQSTQ
ncbi:alkyl/aryl-sulfatase [Aliifodinibius sp. S!AR15-10]|uniref:alkyl/aryl-sulfatase n=1 Tax=Aliifodinibius sp. S!AR15-10 TaxID=2950437 RepID=UPI002863E3A8|nr:alkyl/aryl-sulfatase [Aliifodinibius sp. S!AR15-10]MDR8392571.1 alkyl/aryl-sulfatase [Aliifodinibius sp. S!AR15-10]